MSAVRVLPLLASLVVAGCAGAPPPPPRRLTALKVSDSVQLTEGRFTGAKGLQLYEVSWRPKDREPRAAVVVLHGLKDHADRYAELAELLVGKGYAVHAFDLRGHALSEGERVFVDSFDEYVDDLETFVKRVREQEPGKAVFLMGHSMGGAISAVYAIERKPALQGLILSAAALKPGNEVNGFLIGVAGLLGTLTPRAGVLETKDEHFSRDPAVLEAMKKDPLIQPGNGAARTGRELLNAMERIGKGASTLNVPVLALHGTADKLTNPDGSKELIEKAATPDKTLKQYPGLFHDLVHEPERAQVMADIAAWIEARTK